MILFIFIPRTSEDANPAYDIPAEQQKMWTASRQLWSPRNLRPLMSDMFQKLVKAFAIKPETSPSPETVIVAEYGGECSFLGRQVLARSTCINKCCFLVALGVLEKCWGGGGYNQFAFLWQLPTQVLQHGYKYETWLKFPAMKTIVTRALHQGKLVVPFIFYK